MNVSTPPRASELVSGFLAQRGQELMRLAYLLSGDAHEAQDLLQTSLAKLLSSEAIAEARNPFGYPKRTVSNEFLDRRRRRMRFARARVLLTREPTSVASSETTVVERDALLRAFAVLKQRERACVVLRFYEGWPDAEIATALGCAPGTVRSLISRAMPRLRKALEDMEAVE